MSNPKIQVHTLDISRPQERKIFQLRLPPDCLQVTGWWVHADTPRTPFAYIDHGPGSPPASPSFSEGLVNPAEPLTLWHALLGGASDSPIQPTGKEGNPWVGYLRLRGMDTRDSFLAVPVPHYDRIPHSRAVYGPNPLSVGAGEFWKDGTTLQHYPLSMSRDNPVLRGHYEDLRKVGYGYSIRLYIYYDSE